MYGRGDNSSLNYRRTFLFICAFSNTFRKAHTWRNKRSAQFQNLTSVYLWINIQMDIKSMSLFDILSINQNIAGRITWQSCHQYFHHVLRRMYKWSIPTQYSVKQNLCELSRQYMIGLFLSANTAFTALENYTDQWILNFSCFIYKHVHEELKQYIFTCWLI